MFDSVEDLIEETDRRRALEIEDEEDITDPSEPSPA
jgi:hypothetical protein